MSLHSRNAQMQGWMPSAVQFLINDYAIGTSPAAMLASQPSIIQSLDHRAAGRPGRASRVS
jgi:hypothetical protein